MFEAVKISPSILSADYMNMERDIRMIEDGGADFIHVDVMDGHFVPNLTIGVPVVKQLKGISELPLDVHLMISNPIEQLPWFLDAGADIVTVHVEALQGAEGEIDEAIALIREAGARSALTIKPDTPVGMLKPYLTRLEMVLIMSVYPGFSGQSYIRESEGRVAEVVAMARELGASPLIQVDGGISLATARYVAAEGADVLVAGNAIFGEDDPKRAIAEIRQAATEAQQTALRAAGQQGA